MKKILLIIMAAMVMVSLVACKGNGDVNKTPVPTDKENPNQTDSQDEPSKEQTSIKDSLELLNNVWKSYDDKDKFAVAGGDSTEQNMTTDGPGKFGVKDAEMLNSTLGFPAASIDKIDDAASLMHMMNANTFTCGAFRAKNAGDVSALTTEIKDNIMKRQWMCGFPDKLVIVTVDNYIVSFFGTQDIVEMFQNKLISAYPSAEVVCEEAIA